MKKLRMLANVSGGETHTKLRDSILQKDYKTSLGMKYKTKTWFLLLKLGLVLTHSTRLFLLDIVPHLVPVFSICIGICICICICILILTRRCGPLRGPSSSSCGGRWPSAEAFFCPSGQKRALFIYFGPHFGHFW